MALSKQCKFVIILVSILVVIALAITLPLALKKRRDPAINTQFYYFVDEDNNTLVEEKKNEVDRSNITLSDIARQNETKKDNISTYNDTDAE